ncbi:MAG: UDP-N-acetylmuramate--L-alanine ligase [Flavobacteriaceae bacterium]|nr:UDP-N-acetylmuramate--L-alanine ligase [Flavobacteriaceae bacterium]
MSGLNKDNMYFIGIGGIGMSALARYFRTLGKSVAGYDRVSSEITDGLQALGIHVHFDDSIDQIDPDFLNSETTLIVFTPAIPENHSELNYFRQNGFEILKRAEVLGLITEQTTCLAVAGTHGKTTTSTILAHLLVEAGVEVTAFLGGISENYDSNFIQKGQRVSVVEADEFDRSFLKLRPDFASITSMDADHLDIYGNAENLKESFMAFTKCIKEGGKLFVVKGLPLPGISCAVDEAADYSAHNIRIENGTYVFDLKTPKSTIDDIRFNLPGRHNLSNAVIALAMAIEYGCAPYRLARALASFKGVKRRFSCHIKTDNLVFIDDYAHHPEEINAVYLAVREMFPDKKVLVMFQPHLFSRTRDFADEFARSLEKFDEVWLLKIYPAREEPIEGITSSWLLDKIRHSKKRLISKAEIIPALEDVQAGVIMTLGAGDIGEEVELIKDKLSYAI